MLGLCFIKVQPTDYIIQYSGGKVVREGAGLSFFYFAPSSSLVKIPLASEDLPFIINEVTADYQEVSIQGQVTYRIKDPKKISQLINFTVVPNHKLTYVSDAPEKLPQRLIQHMQVFTSSSIKTLTLKEAIRLSSDYVQELKKKIQGSEVMNSMGIEVLDLSILAIKPKPETAKALEAHVREKLLQEADEAIYMRRNAAVEQERGIRESELNTEIAVEDKKRQIRETQMDAEKSVQQKMREIKEAEMQTQISLEKQKQDYVNLLVENIKQEADAKAYGMSAMTKAFKDVDPKIVQAFVNAGKDSKELIALAFQSIAENAEKIGQLNMSPDLLRELLWQEKHHDEPTNRK